MVYITVCAYTGVDNSVDIDSVTAFNTEKEAIDCMNKIVHDYITDPYGEEKWEVVRQGTGYCELVDRFYDCSMVVKVKSSRIKPQA